MRQRRQSGMADFFQSFNAAYDTVNKVGKDIAIADVANAKPEETSSFVPEQGAEMEKLAGQGYKVDFDKDQNAYVAKNDAGDSKVFGMKQYTDYMGQRLAGSAQENRAKIDQMRAMSMADAIGKYDPQEGMKLRNDALNQAFNLRKQDRDEKSWAREDGLEAIDKELGQKFEAGLVGEDGQRRAPTAADYLQQSQTRAVKLAQAGYGKEAQAAFKDSQSQALTQIQLQGEERKRALGPAMAALGSGDYGAVAEYYNKFVPGGVKITGIEAGQDGSLLLNRTGIGGQSMAPIKIGSQREAMAFLQSSEDPSALYRFSQDEFNNQLKLNPEVRANNAERRADAQLQLSRNADARAGASAGRAAANDARENSEKLSKAEARVRLALEQNPNLSEAQKSAIRYGVLDVPGQGDKGEKHTYNPVEIQKSFGDVVTDTLSGKETIKRNSAKEQKFIDWWADNPQFKSQDRALQEFNRFDSKQRRSSASLNVPVGALEYLKANPDQAINFDRKYGEGAAAKALK